MKVALYATSIDRTSGGTSVYVQLLAKELGKLVDLHIITHQVPNPLLLENCQIHYISKYTNPLHMMRESKSLLKGLMPDAVHINCSWFPGASLFCRCAKQLDCKIVLQAHGMLEPWDIQKNYWTRKLPALYLYLNRTIKAADIIIATSENEKHNLERLLPTKRIGIVPNGLDASLIKIKDNWKRNKQISFLALLRPNKGADILIEAVNILKIKLNEYKVLIAGHGDKKYSDRLQYLIDQYHLGNIVKLVGGVYGKAKWDLYTQSDFFVLPTLNENFGIVIAESLASGTPVITTKGAPWPELDEWHCGWQIERNAQTLAETIEKAINLTEKERMEMGLNGRKLIESKYSSTHIATAMKHWYESLTQ